MQHDHDNEHGHGHSHSHRHDHVHDVSLDADGRYVTIALVLIVGFMVFEIIAGILAHSLALLSDAGHMLTDAGALLLSLVVIRLVQRPVGGQLTYGMRRAEVLSAQANSAVLLVLGVLVIYEAVWRLVRPPDVAGALVTSVAATGVVVNALAAWVLAKANRQSLNVEGSFQHIVTDLYAFMGTLVAGIIILTTGFDRADAIASLFVAVLMIRSGLRLQRRALRVLLESAPEELAPAEVGQAMVHIEHVNQVHDLHLWELAPGHPILTAHVLVAPKADCHAVRRALEQMLKERFKIDHSTLQVDHTPDPVLSITRHQRA
jgi:cobalt-zinc-cadmium efflux system protein